MVKYEEWKEKREKFSKIDVRHIQGNFFPGLQAKAAALKRVFDTFLYPNHPKSFI
jgi:hypothetical protein